MFNGTQYRLNKKGMALHTKKLINLLEENGAL